MKKKLFVCFFFIFFLFPLKPQAFYYSATNLKLFINTGVSYNFPITTDYFSQAGSFFIDIPLSLCFDIRFKEWYSIYTGIEFLYGLHTISRTIGNDEYNIYLHNFFIRIPFLVRFYPMAQKDASYRNFYIATGAILHFWPVNWYYGTINDNKTLSGNAYYPGHTVMPPGNVYTPVNIGTRFSIGNSFEITNRILLGMELYVNYLFIPYINGYYFNENYNRGNAVVLEFNASIGIFVSLGVNLF